MRRYLYNLWAALCDRGIPLTPGQKVSIKANYWLFVGRITDVGLTSTLDGSTLVITAMDEKNWFKVMEANPYA